MKFNLFSKKNKVKDPVKYLYDNLKTLQESIYDEMQGSEFCWNRSFGEKKYVTLLVSRFVFEHTFRVNFRETIDEESLQSYYFLVNYSSLEIFSSIFSSIDAPKEEFEKEAKEELDRYREFRDQNKPPSCWHKLYSFCTSNMSKDEMLEEIEKINKGLTLVKNNPNFSHLVPEYELKLKAINKRLEAFVAFEVLMSKSIRQTKEKLILLQPKGILKAQKKLEKQLEKKK